MKDWFQKKRPLTVLGLAFDGARIDAAVVRRTNDTAELGPCGGGGFTGDLLKVDPAVLGAELRVVLDAAEIRERACVVALPAEWALSLQSVLPELSAEDTASLLQLEAEAGFPYGLEALRIAHSRFQTQGGPAFVTQLAIQREHVERIEAILRAARLTPVSITLGVTAQQAPTKPPGGGVVALFVGDKNVTLLIVSGGGVVALRTLEPAVQGEAGETWVAADLIGRELRVTLGQLNPAVRDSLTHVRIFGGHAADRLAAELAPRAATFGLKLERVLQFAPGELGVKVATATPPTAAVATAGRYLATATAGLEFLPPRVSPWQQFAGKHSAGKLMLAAKLAGGLAVLVLLAFLVQQVQLMGLRSQWSGMATKVKELETLQQQIKRFRPWYDDSIRSLSILRRLTEAFPENGDVTAKTIELRDSGTVICTGTASDNSALLKALDKLRATADIVDVQVDQVRGKSPLQFTFNFQWGGSPRQP
jgi:hypothetical protein